MYISNVINQHGSDVDGLGRSIILMPTSEELLVLLWWMAFGSSKKKSLSSKIKGGPVNGLTTV